MIKIIIFERAVNSILTSSVNYENEKFLTETLPEIHRMSLVRFHSDRSETDHNHLFNSFSLKTLVFFTRYTVTLCIHDVSISKQQFVYKYCSTSIIYITFLALVFVRETVVTRLAKRRRACRKGHGVNIKMDKLPFWGLTQMNHSNSQKSLVAAELRSNTMQRRVNKTSCIALV